ncbi:MAG TPA: anti-sigma factor [Bryobacteraceae bacterium]|nr:anti-sigma factor [Bryobacteraceae bacterium]
MSCEHARALLTAYVDGELDLVHGLEVEKHLEICESCTRAVENQRTLRSALQSAALHYAPPAPLKARIEDALRAEARPQRSLTRHRWPWIAIAAGVLLAAFFFGSWPIGSHPPQENLLAQEILDSHLRSLLPGHLTDVPSSDRHTVKPWFNGKLEYSPPVEDFAAQGFPLAGGRLDAVSGQTVAVLIYKRRQHTINVYVWPASGAADSSGGPATERQGFNLMHWTQGGFHYWVASDVNPAELEEFTKLLRSGAH